MQVEKKEYAQKGSLQKRLDEMIPYQAILDKDNFQASEPHWRQLSKNTISLFQVLIDQDLRELVSVLKHYPRYTPWVCEHFRYAYSYSENEADIDAASELLTLGEPYFSKQFVRNVVRKLPRIDEDLQLLKAWGEKLYDSHKRWHSVITNHYRHALLEQIERMQLHPLQRIALLKQVQSIEVLPSFDYEADDRDAVLDIPYMN